MDTNDRIMQWENMTQADPENAMGWFSLGNAYKDAERYEEAAEAYRKCLAQDHAYSRAYQMLGQVLMQLDQHDAAADVLTRGYKSAAEQGDVMPQKAMGSLLRKLDKPVPDVGDVAPEREISGDQIVDRRTGRPGTRMTEPPMRGPVGQFIADHYSAETWREWIGMGTKVINEFRLDFSNEAHQKVYDDQMMEWLGFTQQEAEEYAREKAQT